MQRAGDNTDEHYDLLLDEELIEDPEPPRRPVSSRAPASARSLPPLPPPPLSPRAGLTRPLRETEPREGDVVAGKYSVERAAGRDGNAVVLHVRHVELGQRLLLKYLPLEACALAEVPARFLRGARAALPLSSEHTVRTLDAGRFTSGLPYVVTEVVEGPELSDLIRVRGAVPLSEAVGYILQVAEAVAEAHRHGLVHGSLSPSSLFVARAPDGSPRVKVADFGVAEALRLDLLTPKAFAGDGAVLESQRRLESLSCMAPEQVRRHELDVRTDLWALGAVLHQMLAGFPVFAADSATGLLAMIVADPAPPLTALSNDVPTELEAVVLRCLEKERSARFESVAELAVALKPFAHPEASLLADRVTRTLGQGSRASYAVPHSRALVHVGSPPAAPRVSAHAPASARFHMMWTTGLVAFGLVGGAVAGSIATRSAFLDSASQRALQPPAPAEATRRHPPSPFVDSARPAAPEPKSVAAVEAPPVPAPVVQRPTIAPQPAPARRQRAAAAETKREIAAERAPVESKVASGSGAASGASLFDEIR